MQGRNFSRLRELCAQLQDSIDKQAQEAYCLFFITVYKKSAYDTGNIESIPYEIENMVTLATSIEEVKQRFSRQFSTDVFWFQIYDIIAVPVLSHAIQKLMQWHDQYPVELNPLIDDYENGYIVEVPALPGCSASGATETEAMKNLEEVMYHWFAISLRRGDFISLP
ncbi:hypothetical protein MTAT_18960 [Moorella thermoacetica]|uniref:HicB-like antitoxin of toxin-antitoxin system domain-containing protein n=1 Tax=Neomoorella thermoacetica TaxID=1525 RepID=A0AAC9MUB7_NEOTH|nr:type II toxin-antitoxin system HicB family antitoxin [Moorella thermoacetica]AOQ24553.1 hypothetical protein Maut_02123 [Moorella thermoacetica]TYL12654.1 hypothetical protein MTAT_18960 [Moorella thermoacetica]